MERNREARRGTVSAVNGGAGVSRRRQRDVVGYRDSPYEEGGIEMQKTGRLRDRGSKKDRDLDRSGRSKRRRGEKVMHASSREEGEESSDDSVGVEDDDDEEEDASVSVRLQPAPSPSPSPSLRPASVLPQNHHRKSSPMMTKATRPPVVWKAGDEMIGITVPRRARSSSVKRPQDFSAASCGVAGELVHRQASTSPARPIPSTTCPVSPSSSSASFRKKMKTLGGAKHRQVKMAKSATVSEDIEIEVAEVLYGLTRQFQPKLESKETNGSSNEARSRVSSPISNSPAPPISQPSFTPSTLSSTTTPASVTIPKRKRPIPVKFQDESHTGLANSVSSAEKNNFEQPTEASSLRSEKKIVENGGQSDAGASQASVVLAGTQQETSKPERNLAHELKLLARTSDGQDCVEANEEINLPSEDCPPKDLVVNDDDTTRIRANPASDGSHEGKFSIDLMAPPPGKSSPGKEALTEFVGDNRPSDSAVQMVPKVGTAKVEVEAEKSAAKHERVNTSESRNNKSSMPDSSDSKERPLDLQFDLDSLNKGPGYSKQLAQKQPQAKPAKIESKEEKTGQSVPFPLPMAVGAWPASFPPFSYMGQVPSFQAVVPMDGSSGAAKAIQMRPKRCATHCYIAHNIHYHQQIPRMNPYWPAAAGATPVYSAKQYNLNVVPPSESSILGNPLQGSIPVRNLGSIQDKGGPFVAAYAGHSTKEKPSAGNTLMDAAQRKQLVLQQQPQPGSANNMLQAPAFIFPMNQQQAVAAAARSTVPKSSTHERSNTTPPASSASSSIAPSSATGTPTTNMTFSYPGMPPSEAAYMAILQNSGYPFPVPAPPYKGGTPAQAMPFFNASFYSSHMLQPPQLQPPQIQQQKQQQSQQPQSLHTTQQGHQNTSTSSGSSSSQKPQQQSHRVPSGGAAAVMGSSQSFPPSKLQRHHLPPQSEVVSEDNPLTSDNRVLHAKKSAYSPNMLAVHPNYAMLSPAAAALSSSGGHNGERQHQHHQQQQPPLRVELTTSQAFAMSFGSFGGAAASGAPPGLDFTMAQNHPLFQNLPEAARHGYQMTAAAVAHTTQHKKPQNQTTDDGKSSIDLTNSTNVICDEDRKMNSTSKAQGNAPHQSLTFSRTDSAPTVSKVVENSVIDSSSRTLNLAQQPNNSSRVSNRAASTAPPTSSSASASAQNPNSLILQQMQQQQQQQQQQLIHLQKQQQIMMNRAKPSAPTNTTTIYSDRLPAGSTMAKFPQGLVGFPQGMIQQSRSSSSSQSPQWKPSNNRGGTPAPSASPASSSAKNQQHSQQQGRNLHQPLLASNHQNQITFGMIPSKGSAPMMQQHLMGGGSNPSLSSAASVAPGSPQSSASKTTGGSPRHSSGAKPGPPVPLQQQQQQQQSSKGSPSNSTLKTSSMSNNAPSILGNPHMAVAAAQTSSSKQQQQHQHHQHQQQQQQQQQHQQMFPQAQLFFSNAYMPSQSHSAAAAGYYHRRQTEQPAAQQQQLLQAQQNPSSGSTGMLTMTLAGSPAMSDPSKAAAAAASGNIKGTTSSMLQHPPSQFGTAAFPYIHTIPAVSAKPAEPKPAAAAGNDSSHPCWQPEKR